MKQVVTTLWALVANLANLAGTEEEIIEQARQLIESGRVRLIGNFAGARFDEPAYGDEEVTLAIAARNT